LFLFVIILELFILSNILVDYCQSIFEINPVGMDISYQSK